ncbi:MAG: CBS domain-containing protein [Candidatus Saccharibacteria bacterium]|nr:CBS domain-containing protein [Candidatus Saccharibacteria bacterium]
MNTAVSIFLIIEALLFLAVVALRAVRINKSELTTYELKRRAKSRDDTAKLNLRKEKVITDLATLRYIKDTILVVILVIFTVWELGWLIGLVASVALLLLANVVARLGFVAHLVQKLYNKYELKILSAVEKLSPGLKYLRTPNIQPGGDFTLHSKEELMHLVNESQEILSKDEKDLLTSALQFQTKPVSKVMTPKSAVQSIDKKELLGPLVLDDLHKTGHSRFPVINRDIDHVVGILYVQDLLTIDTKKSVTAEKAMEPHVFYINHEQTLEHALAGFLRTHHHLFIVVNEFQETVGVLSLEDVIEALIGRKIIDEFDTHEDLREVALRNQKDNNQSEGREDV